MLDGAGADAAVRLPEPHRVVVAGRGQDNGVAAHRALRGVHGPAAGARSGPPPPGHPVPARAAPPHPAHARPRAHAWAHAGAPVRSCHGAGAPATRPHPPGSSPVPAAAAGAGGTAHSAHAPRGRGCSLRMRVAPCLSAQPLGGVVSGRAHAQERGGGRYYVRGAGGGVCEARPRGTGRGREPVPSGAARERRAERRCAAPSTAGRGGHRARTGHMWQAPGTHRAPSTHWARPTL